MQFRPLRARLLLVAGTILAFAGTLARGDEPSKAAREALGEKAVAILQKPTKVEAFRIKPEPTGKKGDRFIAGYPITATARPLDKDFAAKVVKVLFGDKAYSGVSARCFEPGVAFRVWQDQKAVEVLVCFRCTNFEVRLMGEEKAVDDVELHGFGPGLEPFLTLAKEAFPDDREIQSLKPSK